MHALDEGDLDRYEELLAPTVPLSRHIFAAPTPYYKTGVVFLAYLNGHQQHFRMVGGLESGRSVLHLAELFVLADQAGLLRDPELASARMRHVLALAGVQMSSRLCFNSMTADRWPLAEVIDACAEHGIEWIGPWRHKLAELGVEEARRRIDAAGLKVSSLCRGGFFAAENADGGQPARGRGGRRARHRRAGARLRAAGDEGPRARARDDRARHRARCSRTPTSTACGWASSRCTR